MATERIHRVPQAVLCEVHSTGRWENRRGPGVDRVDPMHGVDCVHPHALERGQMLGYLSGWRHHTDEGRGWAEQVPRCAGFHSPPCVGELEMRAS